MGIVGADGAVGDFQTGNVGGGASVGDLQIGKLGGGVGTGYIVGFGVIKGDGVTGDGVGILEGIAVVGYRVGYPVVGILEGAFEGTTVGWYVVGNSVGIRGAGI